MKGSRIKNKKLRLVIVMAGYLIAYFYSYMQLPFLAWSIDVVPMGILYMYIGCESYHFMNTMSKYRKYVLLVGALVFFVCFVSSNVGLGNGYAMDARVWGNILLNPLAAISASVVVICLCDKCKCKHRNLQFIGRNSMAYYGIQAVMVGVLNTIIWKLFPELSGVFAIGVSVVSLGISVAIDSIIVYMYVRWIEPLWKRMIKIKI